jgi:serine/threonine protein phosphatase PrpC
MAYIIYTSKGPLQPVNADAAKEWKIQNGNIYLVCDGINHNDKTMAAVNCFAKNLIESNWTNLANPEKILKDNILDALNLMSPEHENLSFCCCVAIVSEKKMTLAHCGDCRIGSLTDDGVKWLTKDDVPTLQLYNKGIISKEIYDQSRHLISTKLKVGANNLNSLTVQNIATSNIQGLILCSDGFWSEAEDLLSTDVSNIMSVVALEIERLERESQDNYSVVILEHCPEIAVKPF